MMRRILSLRSVVIALAAVSSLTAAEPTKLFVGAWPRNLLVLDESSATVTAKIPLKTDVARTILVSNDKKKLVVLTIKNSGLETVDLATNQVVDSFELSTPSHRVYVNGIALSPDDQQIYAAVTVAEKLIDRFEVKAPEFAVIDLKEKKIVRTAPIPKEAGGMGGRGMYKISPDGKYLWAFRDNIYIFNTADFKLVETIKLARPEFPGMETVSLSPTEDPFDEPGMMTALFNSSDTVVHKRMFGVARINLVTRKIDFTPIAPAVQGMFGMRLSPDRKSGYTVAISGEHGDRHCEFLVIDLEKHTLARRQEFPGLTRFYLSSTTDGKSLIIYGAGFTLDFYSTDTLKLTKSLNVEADMTSTLVPVMAGAVRAAAAMQ